jgi:DNA-binding MarR family transcriptional regulator
MYPGSVTTAETSPDSVLRLDAQLCFAVHAAARAFDSLYRQTLRDSGLTYPQYLVMLVLGEYGELSVKELGRKLRLDSGTLSPLLKRMQAAGWVERQRDAADERSVTVRLTQAGFTTREQASCVPLITMDSTGLGPAEMADLQDRLNALTDSIDAAAPRLATDGTPPPQQKES